MKTLILLTAVLITTISFAQVPSYVPANGLVGWWPFNGNANDESGNGNNGTVNGATLTADRNGIANSAYSFDGVDDYIIGLSNSFPTNQRTVSVWFFSNNIGIGNLGRGVLGYGGNTCGQSWNMHLDNPGSPLGLDSYEVNTHCNVFSVTSSYGSLIPNGNWHNWVVTTDPSGTYFYLDGVIINSSNSFINNTVAINKNFVFGIFPNENGIGASINDPNNTVWNGMIDDIGIWNRALTDCEIQNLYTSTNPSNTTTATACGSYAWNGTTYTSSGVYTDTSNCVTESLNLTITPSSTITQPASQSINISNNVQFIVGSSGSNSIYQWQTNLGFGFQNLNNAGQYNGTTSSTLSITNLSMSNNNQVFRCIISSGSCTDTSDVAVLTVVNNVGFNDLNASKLSIYPNPTNGDFTITGLELLGTVSSLSLTDMNGKVVKVLDTKATKFSMGSIKPGVYFLNIRAGNKQEVLKIVKE